MAALPEPVHAAFARPAFEPADITIAIEAPLRVRQFRRCHAQTMRPRRPWQTVDSRREQRQMVTDYDAPPVSKSADLSTESPEELSARRPMGAAAAAADVDDGNVLDSSELPRDRCVRRRAHRPCAGRTGR
jgi:hypothetical protein